MSSSADGRRTTTCVHCPAAATVQVEISGSSVSDAVLDLCDFHADVLRRRATPLTAAAGRGSERRLL
jgi:hypothetical protein